MTVFKKKRHVFTGQKVIYIPRHAKGNFKHPDCKHGVVTSFSINQIQVKLKGNKRIVTVKPENLVEAI